MFRGATSCTDLLIIMRALWPMSMAIDKYGVLLGFLDVPVFLCIYILIL
jgi:hypothetical protein